MENLYSEKSGHKNNFDFLRFTLATAVVFTHSYVVYSGKIDKEPLWILSNHQLAFGTLALNFFFVISGFLVTQSWNYSTNFFDFLKKRVLRIYPGFIVVCFVCAYVFAPLGLGIIRPLHFIREYWSYININYLIGTSLKLQGPDLPETFKTLPCPNDVNTSLWTIPYEFACYQLVPLLAIFRSRFMPLVAFILIFATNLYHYDIYQQYNMEGTISPTYIPHYFRTYFNEVDIDTLLNFEHFLYPFVAGVCFYSYHNFIPRSIYLVILSLIATIVTTFWIKGFELAQPIFGTYLLFYFIFNRRIKLHNFAKYGDFSYGVYLYGWPIQQLLFLYFGSSLNVLSLFFIAMLFTVPAAFLSWHIIEKPFLSLKNKTLRLAKISS